MGIKRDWIPTKVADFYNKQRAYFALIVANKVAWGIPDAAITPLLTLQAEFESRYAVIQDKKNRTSAQVAAFHDCRKRYAQAWRLFHKEWVAGNSSISKEDMVILVGKEYDTEPSPHPAITVSPYGKAKALVGGELELRFRTDTDRTMSSMHPAANLIECRMAIVPAGDIPPDDPENYPKQVVSSRAKFTYNAGAKNAGQRLYLVARWVNTHKPRQEGPWSDPINVVIA